MLSRAGASSTGSSDGDGGGEPTLVPLPNTSRGLSSGGTTQLYAHTHSGTSMTLDARPVHSHPRAPLATGVYAHALDAAAHNSAVAPPQPPPTALLQPRSIQQQQQETQQQRQLSHGGRATAAAAGAESTRSQHQRIGLGAAAATTASASASAAAGSSGAAAPLEDTEKALLAEIEVLQTH